MTSSDVVLQQELCIEFPLTCGNQTPFFFWYCLKCLLNFETNFITKNFATILAGSFLTQVNAPQVCDVDGWMDGWTIGYRVATALRIVYWPSLSILG